MKTIPKDAERIIVEVAASIERCAGNNNADFHLTWAAKLRKALDLIEFNQHYCATCGMLDSDCLILKRCDRIRG